MPLDNHVLEHWRDRLFSLLPSLPLRFKFGKDDECLDKELPLWRRLEGFTGCYEEILGAYQSFITRFAKQAEECAEQR
jgi:hypothetical protein